MLPIKNPNVSFITTSPSYTLPLRAPTPKPSVTLDPTFKLLYGGSETALRHFFDNKAPLPREDTLRSPSLIEYVQSREPGPTVQYANLRPALSAIRPFLVSSAIGKQLLAYYRYVLQVHGRYIVAAAELLAFEIFVKMTQALFISRDDKKLLDHVNSVVPEAWYTMTDYTDVDRTYFDMFVSCERPRLREANATAVNNLLKLKTSKEFLTMHGRLLKAVEKHEAKLQELRERAAQRKAEREAKIQAIYDRNGASLHRQMGTAGLTAHQPHVEASVCEFTKEIRDEFFSFEGNDEANSEEPGLDSRGLF